ncbi:LON peptidase substrate-binding domain-containing protein [Porticoccus sp.]|uniref:LON peptidase substrate-binding domain-containing protein n=1 Tax=Porticoccus sp. TaxID=2024853 RepID=UPI000C69E1EF|nr:LON peptidase substrate-binding domain-containing protein [Porticoccus sp.]MAZ69433.1 ATP-dependent protease [Porticoccus sp.]|tara:strand:+ start:22709 stop:23299 length:591 start_codon:yes stop_codon:yes gene_type:complete
MTETTRLPLFPLTQPLFPGTTLNLQIFEQRYLRMITECFKKEQPFGIVPILEGSEVGAVPRVYPWGVIAEIIDWSQLENGLLGIMIRGNQRFQLLNSEAEQDGLVTGMVRFCPPDEPLELDDSTADLLDLLMALAEGDPIAQQETSVAPQDANALGWQLARLLPIEPELRISLLELNDPGERLQQIRNWLITMSQS